MPTRKPARRGPLRQLVCLFRQARDANAGVAFVANVEADQERGDLLQDARVFQFAAVDGADAGNFCRQRSYRLGCRRRRRCRRSRRNRREHRRSEYPRRYCETPPPRKRPAGTSSAACCAAEPSQMPRVRVARPPTLAARGTVVSTTMLPGRIAGLICLSRAQWPSNGMVSTIRSAAAQAAVFSSPETFALLPTAAWIFAAASRARSRVPRSDDHGLARPDPAQGESKALRAGAAQDRDSARITGLTSLMRTPARALLRTRSVQVAV